MYWNVILLVTRQLEFYTMNSRVEALRQELELAKYRGSTTSDYSYLAAILFFFDILHTLFI
jgi:hypothetical protein